ncbi:MAG: helicase-related protein [Thermomicrobiales bacterium]
MTATPIPRTLNMVLHGDLDVSVLAERPPGRSPIITARYLGVERSIAYDLVREQVGLGRQVFVICPLVEASDVIEAKAAVDEAHRLQSEIFPELRVAVLHGRMKAREKDAIMEGFRNRDADLLVSTSVIEVGIDVPNATVMIIEGADRFGLAQLHQFRGRVGRGSAQSYCLLLAENVSADGEARLETMVESDDGFLLAERDLELRGPGDFIGTRQSGLPEMTPWTVGWLRYSAAGTRPASRRKRPRAGPRTSCAASRPAAGAFHEVLGAGRAGESRLDKDAPRNEHAPRKSARRTSRPEHVATWP